MKQNPTDKSLATIDAGREVADALKQAYQNLPVQTQNEIGALAARITLCNSKRNHWLIRDAWHPETGEAFDATGQFWRCGSKLCSGCLREHARRSRVKVRNALDAQKLRSGERYYFITFTIPNPARSLADTREIVNYAWSLFRKKKIVCDLIRGGVKSEEFTLSASGYHYHLHSIALAKFLPYNSIRRAWSDSVDAAFTKFGIVYTARTSDGMCIVNFKPLSNREGAVQEVCKYITKSDSWTRMRRDDLVNVALIRRWPRMLEFFGCFKTHSAKRPYVHTRNLSDGETSERSEYWRSVVDRIGAKAYRTTLVHEFEQTILIRTEQLLARWPGTSIVDANSF